MTDFEKIGHTEPAPTEGMVTRTIRQQAERIEKLETALRMVIDWDNTLDWEDGPAWGDLMEIVSKALEGKDE